MILASNLPSKSESGRQRSGREEAEPFRPPPAALLSGGQTGTAIFGGSLRGEGAGMTLGLTLAFGNGVGESYGRHLPFPISSF